LRYNRRNQRDRRNGKTMTTRTFKTVDPTTEETIVFAIEDDPNWIADKEYQDEDGNWWPVENKEEEVE
jgi:hypothetical protein